MTEQNFGHLATGKELKDTDKLPPGSKGPSEEQLKQMRAFAENYRRSRPNASVREVKRAILRKFPLKIIK